MKKILILILGMFLILTVSQLGFVNADGSLGTFKQSDCIELYQYCNNCTYVNLTRVQYPNGTIITINSVMEKDDVDYNYTYCNTSDLGIYYYTVKGDKDGEVNTERMSFEITPTGKDFGEKDSISALGILFGALIVAFLFMFIGFKMSDNPKLIPLSFFFVVLALILIIYSLFLGYTIGNNIIGDAAFSETASTIFVSFLWLIVGVAIISTVLMLFAFIKELGKIVKKRKFGEDFNPITDTYDLN